MSWKPIAFLLLILLSGCKTYVPKFNKITKVELARSGAWSDYGATISIDSVLNYKYFGDYANVKQGYFIGKFDVRFWDTLNHKLEAANFRIADTATNMNVKDARYYELIIQWESGKKRLLRLSDMKADSILSLCRWIDTTYKRVKLKRVDQPFKFETVFHSPLPKPSFNNVKFPPPNNKY